MIRTQSLKSEQGGIVLETPSLPLPSRFQQHNAIVASFEFYTEHFSSLEMLPNLQNNTKCHFLELAAFSEVACCIMHQAVKCASQRKVWRDGSVVQAANEFFSAS